MRVRVALAVILVALGISRATFAADHPWTQPGLLRYGNYSEPDTLNPVLTRDTTDQFLNELTSDLLVGADADGTPFPDLAMRVPSQQNGDISRDGLTVTYHLRHGVRWQDGQPFTAHDVAFSYAAVENPRNDVAGRDEFAAVARVTTPDALTVVVRLKHPSGPIVAQFFGESDEPIHLIPAHLLEQLPDLNHAAYNSLPIGTGPFRVVRWERGNRIELVANDDYFRGRPLLRRIDVMVLPDMMSVANAIRTHEIDFAAVDSPTYRQMLAAPETNHVIAPGNNYAGYAFNLRGPLTRDLRVRQAVAYAFDKRAFVAKTSFGLNPIATADLPPQSWGHNPHVTTYPYEPARARRLLEGLGWHVGPDGIRVKNGARLTLTIVDGQGSMQGRNEDVQLQAMLRAVGIDAQIRTYPYTLIFAPAAAGGIIMKGNFDMISYGWVGGSDPNNASQFTCGAPPPGNISRYCNAAVDAAEQDQLASYDTARRKRDFAVIEERLAADLPALWLYWGQSKYLMNPDFQGFSRNCCGEGWNAYRWSI